MYHSNESSSPSPPRPNTDNPRSRSRWHAPSCDHSSIACNLDTEHLLNQLLPALQHMHSWCVHAQRFHAVCVHWLEVQGLCSLTVSEPRSTSTATTFFAFDNTTFGARHTCDADNFWWCSNEFIKATKDNGCFYIDQNLSTRPRSGTYVCRHWRRQSIGVWTPLWRIFPHFLYQAPPGAQQLARPDCLNVPHFGHAEVIAIVFLSAGIGELTTLTSSRSSRLQTMRDIEPDEPANMRIFLAFERTQATPQSFCRNDVASINMKFILLTLDTSQCEIIPLKDFAFQNMPYISCTRDTSHFEMSPLKDRAQTRLTVVCLRD